MKVLLFRLGLSCLAALGASLLNRPPSPSPRSNRPSLFHSVQAAERERKEGGDGWKRNEQEQSTQKGKEKKKRRQGNQKGPPTLTGLRGTNKPGLPGAQTDSRPRPDRARTRRPPLDRFQPGRRPPPLWAAGAGSPGATPGPRLYLLRRALPRPSKVRRGRRGPLVWLGVRPFDCLRQKSPRD